MKLLGQIYKVNFAIPTRRK